MGRIVTGVDFHDSHGLIIDLLFHDGTKLAVCTYEDDRSKFGDFFVGVNGKEL